MRAPTLTPSLAHHAHLRLTQHVPGIAFATLIGLGAWGLQHLEVWLIGQAVLDALVLALILGMLWRNLIGVSLPYRSGIAFTGKYVLEGAVVLLGASIDLPALLQASPTLLLAIMVVVTVGISASTRIGRGLRLPAKVATLIVWSAAPSVGTRPWRPWTRLSTQPPKTWPVRWPGPPCSAYLWR